MTISGRTFIQKFESYCPQWLAEEGDPVGLHIGTLDKPIQRVMMTLDVRPEVVEEAIKKKIDLLIAKHPPIFRPVKRPDNQPLKANQLKQLTSKKPFKNQRKRYKVSHHNQHKTVQKRAEIRLSKASQSALMMDQERPQHRSFCES